MSFLCIYNWIIMIFIVERGLKAVVESHSSATKTTRVLLLHRSLSRSINTTFLISPVHWTCVVPPCLVSSKHWRFFFQSEQLCLNYFNKVDTTNRCEALKEVMSWNIFYIEISQYQRSKIFNCIDLFLMLAIMDVKSSPKYLVTETFELSEICLKNFEFFNI